MTSQISKNDENPFKVQLSNFETQLKEDLDARNAEIEQKWGFNFGGEKPLELPTRPKFSWERIEVTNEEKPFRPACKPQMQINLGKKDDYRSSIFSASNGVARSSESAVERFSTAEDSIFNSSLAGSFGKNSLIDFNMNMSANFCRTSIVQKRRKTEVEVAKRESEGSLNQRASSPLHQEEEGRSNLIQTLNVQKKKSSAEQVEIEEFKQADEQSIVDSHRSGSASGRPRQAMRSILEPSDQEVVDEAFPSAQDGGDPSEQMNNDEDCDLKETDERGPQQMPHGQNLAVKKIHEPHQVHPSK